MTLAQSQSAVTLSRFGEAEVLTFNHGLPLPSLQAGQVLVKVAFAGINPVDYKTRQGLGWGAEKMQSKYLDQGQPAILGFDLAGEVVASKSAKFGEKDRVAALQFDGGSYAEFVVVDESLLSHVPDQVAMSEAGALPCVGTTAKQMVAFAKLKAGEHVVINAPAGGVGHLAVQMLIKAVREKQLTLTLICSPDKYQRLGALIDLDKLSGWIDYTVDKPFPNLQADVLFDLVGGDAGERALAVVKDGGRVVVLPSIWADKLKEAGKDRHLQVSGFIVHPNSEDLTEVLQQVASKELTLHIQSTYKLEQAADAHRALERGDSFGKIVLRVNGDE